MARRIARRLSTARSARREVIPTAFVERATLIARRRRRQTAHAASRAPKNVPVDPAGEPAGMEHPPSSWLAALLDAGIVA